MGVIGTFELGFITWWGIAVVGQRPGQPKVGAEPRRIVLVEDELFIRLALANDLSDAGFVVLQAGDAGMALVLLQSSKIDLLITDIRMPGAIDGLALAQYTRATWPQIKIMFVSANLSDLPATAPADATIEKPFAPDAVLAAVEQLLTGPAGASIRQ